MTCDDDVDVVDHGVDGERVGRKDVHWDKEDEVVGEDLQPGRVPRSSENRLKLMYA